MASDGVVANIPVTSLVQGSQAPTAARVQEVSGNVVPPSGNAASSNAVPSNTPSAGIADAQTLVTQLNKVLNESGRPDQYRVDPSSGDKMIQQINPASGAVVGEFLASEFPALARSVGISGLLFDSHA
jgi:hypothetical protein